MFKKIRQYFRRKFFKKKVEPALLANAIYRMNKPERPLYQYEYLRDDFLLSDNYALENRN